MSNVFDNIVNDSLGSSKAEQPDEKLSKRVTLSYGQVSTPLPLVTSSASGSAVNPVVFSSPDGQDKSISTTAVTRSEPEQINDFDQLKQFTIPKKRKAKKELLESIRLDSREFQHDVLPVIQQSFKSHNARNYFTFLQAKLVHNAQLFSQFVERRKQMRHEGYSEKEVQDSYAFMCVDSEPEASKICKHGLHVGHSTLTCLGNPQMGLYLSRHADIVRASPFLPGFSGILLVFKIMKGKLKLMAESASNAALDPTPNYDCHMSKAVSADVFSMMPQQAFEATQMYIYEYGDLDLEEQPRQICPYAMVHFCHTGDQQVYRRPTLVSQHAIKPSQRPTSALKSVVSQRAPYLARQQSNPQHAPLSPTIDIPSDPAMPVLTVERERKVGDCAIPTELRRVSEGVASTEPRRVGEETMGGGGGLIVWEGEVTTRGCVLCNAELVSYCGGIKPARIGQELPLDCGQPLVKLKDKCFSHVTTLEKCEEVMADNRHYTYCELRPTKTTQGKFNQIMTFLAKRQIGIIIRLPDNILMVMLTNSELTQNLGLSEAHSHPFLLHCVFISSVSRHVQLQERLGRQPQQGSKVPHLNPLTQTHDNELPKLNRFTSRSAPNLVQESLHDEDFRKFVPLTSLVYRDTLSIDFEIQANVQDQHNIDIARGIITPSRQPGHGDGALHQVVPLSGVVERGFGMEKRQVLPQSSPIGSHSMPELSGGIHCHQVSPSSMSHGPMPVHHSHSFDQSPRLSRDIEPEFAAPCGQYSDPSIAFHSGQSNMPYGRPQVNDGYTAAVQQPRHSSQSYGEHRGAAHLLPSPPMPQLQQPHWPSTQTLTYPQVSYTRPASTTTHTTPNVPRQVSDPRLLRNRCSTADGLHSTPATSIAPFGAMNAAAVTTIQNQNLVERLSVGPSLSTGTSVQRHLMSTSPSSTGQVTGRICGTASMAQPLTERRITGDDRHVETTLKTGSADGAADGTKGFRSGGVTVVNSCSDVRATNLELVPTPVDLLVPPGGRQSGFKLKSSSMEIDEMSDDLVDQIVRGCALTARLKPAMTLSADTCPPSLPLDSHPAMTVATPVADCVTSQQLSHEISEEMAKIKMLKNKMQTVAAIATATTTSSVPFLSFGSVSMPKVQIAPSVVAVHTINTATTETAMLTPTNQKSDSSKRHHHRISKQTVAASKPSGGKKEKEKDKGKRKKSTSVIRTANDMKLFLNANKGHKRDRRVTKRTVTQKKTDPRTTKGVGMKKSRVEHTKQKPLSNISQSAQSAHLDILKSLKALTHSPTKSKSSLVERGNAADKQTLVAGNTSHHKIHVSGSGLNFPDAVGQSKKFYLSQSLCLKVSIQNDSRPPEGGTGVGSIGDEIIDSMDLVGIRDIGDTDELDGIASPPHEVVSEFEIPEIPAAAQVGSAGDTGLPPLTQQSTDAVHQKTVSFLKDITPQIFSPILAAKGLDPFNRVLFEGATVHVGGAIDDIAVTFTRDTSDLKSDVGDKLEKDEMLEQCLFEAMHRYESEESEPETEAEMEMTDLWHISLHYLLPIIDWLQLHNREVMEDSDRGEEGKENTAPTAVLGQKPDTLTAAATAPEATAATAETTTAAAETTAAVTSAVTTEAATASPLVTSSTAVSTPMAVVITPIQPTGPNQVIPAVSDCLVSPPDTLHMDETAERVCVCGGQSEAIISVSVSAAQCPLSPLSLLSTSSSDVCLVAVEITPAKPWLCPAGDTTKDVALGDAVSMKQEEPPMEGNASDDHSSDDCYIVNDNSAAVTTGYRNSPEVVIVESDFFIDSQPIRQMQVEKETELCDVALSSLSDSELDPQQEEFAAEFLPSAGHLIPLFLLDTVSDAPDTILTTSTTCSRSKQPPPSRTGKRRQPMDSETCWVKVGQTRASPVVISPSVRSACTPGNKCTVVSVGGTSKRCIIEVTPTGDRSGQPSKKVCVDKGISPAVGVGEGRGPTSSPSQDMSSNGARSMIFVRQETVALGEKMASSPRATRRLQKKARSFESPCSQPMSASNYMDTDLRTVIVNLRNEKVTKTNQRSINVSGKNHMEGDNLKVPGKGKSRPPSRRGRSDSELNKMEEKAGKDGSRLQNRNSRWDSESASRYSNGSRYVSHAKTERASSTRRGQDVRSRLTTTITDDSRSRGGNHKTTVAGGKATTSSNSSTDRFHPYRRPSRQSLAIQERLTSYNEARDLDELMSCLTSPCYKGRRKQLGRFGPLLNLFARPQLYHTARFDTYNYTPDTIRDTTTMGDREMEMRDVPYKAEEIPNYNERKEKANILDKHINSSSTSNDQQMAALNAEQQFYPVASTENTVEVQSGKLGDAKDGTSAATTSGKTMASVANARRSSPPTRL